MLNRWPNAADLQRIECPTFFLHADQDQLIDVQQSIQMYRMRKKLSLPSELYIQRSVEGMSRKDHNTFDFEDDVISPIQSFFRTFITLKEEEEKTHSLDNEAIPRAAFTPAMYTQYEVKKNTVAAPPCYKMLPFPRFYILGKSTNALHLIAHVIYFIYFLLFFIYFLLSPYSV